MYEGAPVNVDHDRRPGAERSLSDRIGVLRNARLRDGAIVADLVLHKSHPMCEQILDMALNDPRGFGLSHDAVGECVESRGGETVVNRITRVRSVDLVGCPATVAGLFESVGRSLREEDMRMPGDAMHDDRTTLTDVERLVLKVVRNAKLSRAQKLNVLGEILDAHDTIGRARSNLPESWRDTDRLDEIPTDPESFARRVRGLPAHRIDTAEFARRYR